MKKKKFRPQTQKYIAVIVLLIITMLGILGINKNGKQTGSGATRSFPSVTPPVTQDNIASIRESRLVSANFPENENWLRHEPSCANFKKDATIFIPGSWKVYEESIPFGPIERPSNWDENACSIVLGYPVKITSPQDPLGESGGELQASIFIDRIPNYSPWTLESIKREDGALGVSTSEIKLNGIEFLRRQVAADTLWFTTIYKNMLYDIRIHAYNLDAGSQKKAFEIGEELVQRLELH